MSVRWRLGVLGVQLIVLLTGTFLAVGEAIPRETWFLAGLLSLVVNPQLLEPYYSRPGDVIGSAILALVLYATEERNSLPVLWNFFAVTVAIFGAAALVGLILGASRSGQPGSDVGRAARTFSQRASARVIFSAVFFLALFEDFNVTDRDAQKLLVTWAVVMLLGAIRWDTVWSGALGKSGPVTVLGLTGPSTLFVTAADIPEAGEMISLVGKNLQTEATVVTRIRRQDDVWAQLLVADSASGEKLLKEPSLTITIPNQRSDSVGSVSRSTTDTQLRFISNRPLEIAQVVAVDDPAGGPPILHQISSATIEEQTIVAGGQLVTHVVAEQVGVFDTATFRLRRHRWVPPPGAPIRRAQNVLGGVKPPPDDATRLRIGDVVGTDLPVILDLEQVSTGHLAVLGMTKMGKTTLALRLIRALSEKQRVVILDQTGEYVRKHKLPEYDRADDWADPGISVKETGKGDSGPLDASNFMDTVVEKAAAEYEVADPVKRTIVVEEAHQFIPEPSSLTYGQERDAAYQLGILVMQIRKYGISMVLVSQRTAVVAKSALTQCENIIAFRSVDKTGLEYMEEVAGPNVRRMLPALRQGEAVLVGPAFSSEAPVAVSVAF